VRTLAPFPRMLEHDRPREGLLARRAACLLGLSVREYREIKAGGDPDADTWERMCEVFGWPTSYWPHESLVR
jgi:hypothetical protein